MPRLDRTALLLAGLWGLTGCTDHFGHNSAGSSSPPATTVADHNQPLVQSNGTGDSGSIPAENSQASGTSASGPTAGPAPSESDLADPANSPGSRGESTAVTQSSAEAEGYAPGTIPGAAAVPPAELPATRTFRPEGAEQALRITYDDLDLLKWLQMDPVTPDCVEKMPGWMRELNGKKVRLRGFMKPHEISTGFRRFVFVKDTGLCCFGPAGKIYDLIEVTLQKGTTTDYIELTPFDVIGTFRIKIKALDDTQEVYELFQIDDAKIVRK